MLNEIEFNILVAYPYMSKETVNLISSNKYNINFLLDSGAFTAWKKGSEIKLDDYCKYIESLPFKNWKYFVLDVIGDPSKTLKNYEIMLKRGFKPIPIFTRGGDPLILENYYKTSDTVAVGGLVGTRGNRGYVKGIMRHIERRRVHWLGFINMPFIKAYRPASVDSSSWAGTARFGMLHLYHGQGKILGFTRKDLIKKPITRIKKLLHQIGIETRQFRCCAADKAWSQPWQFDGRNWEKPASGMVQFISTLSHVKRAVDVERYLKTKIYLAGNCAFVNRTLFWAYDYLKERQII